MKRLTVPVCGIGETIAIHVRTGDEARVEALLPFLAYGPDYRRGVLSDLRDYSLFAGRSDDAAAELSLSYAEAKAR